MPATAANPIPELSGLDPRALPDAVLRSTSPLVLRGLVDAWPLVHAARASAEQAVAYLARFDQGAMPATAMVAPPGVGGRIFYDDDLQGFNFRHERIPLAVALKTLLKYQHHDSPPTIYLGATTIDTYLPGLRAENDLDLGDRDPLASVWIGNRSRIPAHQDLPDNLACVAAGRRRFTLFPPDQLANLYIGPLDFTPAGQAVSLVDFAAPDLARFPGFAEALRHALDSFNVLVNYWWRQSPAWMDTPMNALMLAIMTVRDLPPEQRAIWRDVFDHYVFDAGDDTAAHIPESARRLLAPLGEDRARELRARLLQRLNR